MRKRSRTPKPGVHRDGPAKRRLQELRRLPFQVLAISPWHYRVGSLHIWIHAGRWWNEATKVQGSLRTVSIRTLAISEWNRQLECLISKLNGGQLYSA
ncbi:MAG: hypothetical protein ACJ746_21180 [Bryobacteraceae bacterium]